VGLRRTILRNVTAVTMNPAQPVVRGNLVIETGRIAAIGEPSTTSRAGDDFVHCEGMVAIPGIVQAHIHLTQTLFRNRADDLELMDWLRQRIWPYEAAHDEASSLASARLGLAELVAGGTTAILDMGTVKHHDAIFRAAEESGIRYTGGKTMMDIATDGVPAGLRESTKDSLDEAEALAKRWHGKAMGRLRYAYAPRFVVTCTDELLKESALRAKALGTPVHIHASENRGEIDLVRKRTGKGNLEWLEELGVLGSRAAIAHCVHLDEGDESRLKNGGASAVHCPSSNLKLASGICPVPRLLEAGVNVALGADGAPCTNNLDGLLEMLLAALIQKPLHGPRAMPAAAVLRMATLGGARALGLDKEIGSLEIGKRADLVVLDLLTPHTSPFEDPVSAVVYAARPENVKHVLVDGEFIKRDFRLHRVDTRDVSQKAGIAFEKLAQRM
jgi:cytosine/adenosine deaminase-related metal-dependent hydrolase